MQKPFVNYYLQNSNNFQWGIGSTLPQYKIDELLPLIKGKKILDIGCGPGHLVNLLSQKGFNAFGIDPIPKFIEYAQKKYQGNYQVADATHLPFKSHEFDTVILKSVMEHLDDDLSALKEALRIGKNIIVIVPQTTPQKLLNRGLIYSHYQDKTHQRTYTPKTLKKLIKTAHGKLVEIKEIEKLPAKSVVFELISGSSLFKRILVKIIFIFFKEPQYYLELLAIIKPC